MIFRKAYGIMGGVVLSLSLVAMITITYSTFNKTLNINGLANVKAQSWNVHFLDDSIQKSTTGTATATDPTINATTIRDFNVSFGTPGDEVTYTFKVKNSGTFNAVVSAVTIWPPLLVGSGTYKTDDEDNVRNNLEIKLLNSNNTEVEVGQTLDIDEEKTMKLVIKYKSFSDESLLVHNTVNLSNIQVALNYQQAS